MRVLLMDTCGVSGSVALAEGSAVVAYELMPGRSSSERLVPAIRSLLEGQGWRLDELAGIAVVHGPGSFTGVRVGLSAAKGLSEAAGLPLVAISRLAVLAQREAHVWAVLDAGRDEFYVGEYRAGKCVREELLSRDELLEAAAAGTVIVCEARVFAVLSGVLPVRMVAEPAAGDALAVALRRLEAGQVDDAVTVDANYLRRTDTQLFARSKAVAD